MSASGREDVVKEHTDTLATTGQRLPMTSLPPSHDDINILPGSGDALTSGPQDLEREQNQVQNDSVIFGEDYPKPSPQVMPGMPGFTSAQTSSEISQLVQNHSQQQLSDHTISHTPSTDVDYFASQIPHDPYDTNLGQRTSTTSRDSSTPTSPETIWKDFSQNQHGSFTAHTPRPTSVPNFQSQNISRRREGPDYPNYPDQSFRALQDQHYPSPYRARSPRPLRTRSSQSPSFSPSDSQTSIDLPRIPSGAKTAGNTPAQSPGLFSPTFAPRRRWPGETDEGRSSTPMLHPTHHKPPKE